MTPQRIADIDWRDRLRATVDMCAPTARRFATPTDVPGVWSVPVTGADNSVIDAIDVNLVERLVWVAKPSRKHLVYAQARLPGTKNVAIMVLMHRLVADAKRTEHVDHINGNPLDNRRCNLRLCTDQQNKANRGPSRKRAGMYKGVYPVAGTRWEAKIKANGKCISLGTFYEPTIAALAYDEAASRLHGKFAKLNFPRQPAESI